MVKYRYPRLYSAWSFSEFKLRLSRIFLALHLDVPPMISSVMPPVDTKYPFDQRVEDGVRL